MTASDWLLPRSLNVMDVPQLLALLSMPCVAEGYFGSPRAIGLAADTLAHNLAKAGEGRGEVWVGCVADRPTTVLAYAAVVDGRLAYLVHPE